MVDAAVNKRKIRLKRWGTAALFMAPAVVLFIVFRYYPLLDGIRISFVSWTPSDASQRFIGLANYEAVFSSIHFWTLVGNTALIFVWFLCFNFWVPIVQSLLLYNVANARTHAVLRYLFVLPAALPTLVTVIIWRYIWDPAFGMANNILALLSLPEQKWLGDPQLVKPVLLLPGLLGGGLSILIYLAAITNISQETIEAAIIDGASALQRTTRIILPSIRFIIEIQFILAVSISLLQFDYVYAMTKGGPGYSSTTVVMGVYFKAFTEYRYSEATAWSMAVTLISVALTAMSLRMSKGEAN